MGNIRDGLDWYIYYSDAGIKYRVHLTESIALAGLFSEKWDGVTPIPALKKPDKMRRVKLFTLDRTKINTIPVCRADSHLYLLGGLLLNAVAQRSLNRVVERFAEKIKT